MATKKLKRLDRNTVTEMAWSQSDNGLVFTAHELAVKCGMSDNHHFRAHLNRLVKVNLLVARRPLCSDGHYRKYFMSHKTAQDYPDFQNRLFKEEKTA